jgi:hypothetical protein
LKTPELVQIVDQKMNIVGTKVKLQCIKLLSKFKQDHHIASAECNLLRRERNHAITKYDMVIAECSVLRQERDSVIAKNEAAVVELELAIAKYDLIVVEKMY